MKKLANILTLVGSFCCATALMAVLGALGVRTLLAFLIAGGFVATTLGLKLSIELLMISIESSNQSKDANFASTTAH